MSYTEDLLFLKKNSYNYIEYSTQWLLKNYQEPNKKFRPVSVNEIQVGSLYFMNYEFKSV